MNLCNGGYMIYGINSIYPDSTQYTYKPGDSLTIKKVNRVESLKNNKDKTGNIKTSKNSGVKFKSVLEEKINRS